MEELTQLPPFVHTQRCVRMSDHSESQHQLREAGHHLSAYIPYGYRDAAILLHPGVMEFPSK